jgi:hypothetical protein
VTGLMRELVSESNGYSEIELVIESDRRYRK